MGIEPFDCSATQTLNVSCIFGVVVGDSLCVGYREKGYPKQDPKNDCLDFVKIETS